MPRKTPKHLDKYFDRGVIEESQYREFWPRYWKTPEHMREQFASRFAGDVLPPISASRQALLSKYFGSSKPEEITTKIRTSLVSVKRDISRLEKATNESYRIVKRDRFGHFNPRGRSYQAVKTTKKGNKK